MPVCQRYQRDQVIHKNDRGSGKRDRQHSQDAVFDTAVDIPCANGKAKRNAVKEGTKEPTEPGRVPDKNHAKHICNDCGKSYRQRYPRAHEADRPGGGGDGGAQYQKHRRIYHDKRYFFHSRHILSFVCRSLSVGRSAVLRVFLPTVAKHRRQAFGNIYF